MHKFASQCTTRFLKFNKVSRYEHVTSEFAKFAFVIFALVMCAFAKCVRISQIHRFTKLILNTIRISDENVNKLNALENSLFDDFK